MVLAGEPLEVQLGQRAQNVSLLVELANWRQLERLLELVHEVWRERLVPLVDLHADVNDELLVTHAELVQRDVFYGLGDVVLQV